MLSYKDGDHPLHGHMRTRPPLLRIGAFLFLIGVAISIVAFLLSSIVMILLFDDSFLEAYIYTLGILLALMCFFLYWTLVAYVAQKGLVDVPTYHIGLLKYFDRRLVKNEELSIGWQRYITRPFPELFNGTLMEEGKWFILPGMHSLEMVNMRQENTEITVEYVHIGAKDKSSEKKYKGGVSVTVNLTRFVCDFFEFIECSNPQEEFKSAVEHAIRDIARHKEKGPQSIIDAILFSEDFSKSIFLYFSGKSLDQFDDASQEINAFFKDANQYVQVKGTGYAVNFIKTTKVVATDKILQDELNGIAKEILQESHQIIQGRALGKTIRATSEGLLFPDNFADLPKETQEELIIAIQEKMKRINADPKLFNQNVENTFINNEKIKDVKVNKFSIDSTTFSDDAIKGLGDIGKAALAGFGVLQGKKEKGDK